MPETPRFLMSVGREEEAMGFLVKYHGNGNPDDELVLFEFEEIKEAIKMEKIARGTSWKTLLSSRGNQHRLGLAALMSFMVSLSGCESQANAAQGERCVLIKIPLSTASIFYYYCKYSIKQLSRRQRSKQASTSYRHGHLHSRRYHGRVNPNWNQRGSEHVYVVLSDRRGASWQKGRQEAFPLGDLAATFGVSRWGLCSFVSRGRVQVEISTRKLTLLRQQGSLPKQPGKSGCKCRNVSILIWIDDRKGDPTSFIFDSVVMVWLYLGFFNFSSQSQQKRPDSEHLLTCCAVFI